MDTVYRGTVTRVTTDGVYVEVPRLGLGVEFGPCDVVRPPVAVSSIDQLPYTEQDSDASAGATSRTWRTHDHPDFGQGGSSALTLAGHRHQIKSGYVGVKSKDRVLLTTVGGVAEDLVVIGLLG